jgi:hypothetical protein
VAIENVSVVLAHGETHAAEIAQSIRDFLSA